MAENPKEPVEFQHFLAEQLPAALSERQIRRQLLVDRMQDRLAVFPLGLSAAALVYTLLYAPVLGGFLAGLVVFILAGLVGALYTIWQLGFRYQQNYALKSQELVAYYEEMSLVTEEARLRSAAEGLEGGFGELKYQQGLNILHKLEHEYNETLQALSTGKETDLLSMAGLESLVRETYYRGLSVLQDVLDLERAIRATSSSQLQSEIGELEKKASGLRKDPAQRSRLDQINERIQANQERLHIVLKLKQRVEELLFQASRCESSLGKARIELAALKADASDIGVSTVTETLRRTIDRALEVQSELKQMGY